MSIFRMLFGDRSGGAVANPNETVKGLLEQVRSIDFQLENGYGINQRKLEKNKNKLNRRIAELQAIESKQAKVG